MKRLFASVVLAAAALCLAGSARAEVLVYVANLDGPSESPPNASPGIGLAQIDFDTIANTMRVQASFSGLLGTTSAAHIHAPTAAPDTGTAGVATQTPYFTGFPIGVTSGTYDHTFDLTLDSTYSSAYRTANGGTAAGAEAALLAAAADGKAYFNVHTSAFPGGEIRGFLQLQVPEPAALTFVAWFLLGGLAVAIGGLRRRKAT